MSKYGIFSGPYFPEFELNTEYIFSPNAGKYGSEKHRMSPYKTQSIDFQSKSMDWYLYDSDFRRERVKDTLMQI